MLQTLGQWMAGSVSTRKTITRSYAQHLVMSLINIYERPDRYGVLYKLLSERKPEESISHQRMPTFQEHCEFVDSQPYEGWYFILGPNQTIVGSCYLSKQNEVGCFVFHEHRNRNYGTNAVRELRMLHGHRRYVANVSPRNEASLAMFRRLGFKEIQRTFEL